MRLKVFCLASVLFVSCAHQPSSPQMPPVQQPDAVSALEPQLPPPPARRPGCQSRLDQAIEKNLQQDFPGEVSRVGAHDLMLPLNEKNYKAMNKMAVLGVTLLSRDPKDLPAHRFYVATENGVSILPRLLSVSAPVVLPEDSPVAQKFGRYREDVFLLIPIRFLKEKGELGARLKDRVSRMPLAHFPISIKQKFILKDKKPHEDPQRIPNRALVEAVLSQAYCL